MPENNPNLPQIDPEFIKKHMTSSGEAAKEKPIKGATQKLISRAVKKIKRTFIPGYLPSNSSQTKIV